jgi:hypothetical protein
MLLSVSGFVPSSVSFVHLTFSQHDWYCLFHFWLSSCEVSSFSDIIIYRIFQKLFSLLYRKVQMFPLLIPTINSVILYKVYIMQPTD